MLRSALIASLALAMTAPVWAQETTTETDDAAPAGETPSTLSMGVDEGPQLGQTYVEAEFGDWVKRCIKTEQETDPCQLYQLLTDEEGNPVVEVNLFKLENSGQAVAGAAIVVPLETLLTQNLTLGVDQGRAKVYPYTFCNVQGCVSRIGFSAEDIASFKAGNEGKVTIVPAGSPNNKVTVSMGLSGFTAGYDDLVPNNQQ